MTASTVGVLLVGKVVGQCWKHFTLVDIFFKASGDHMPSQGGI